MNLVETAQVLTIASGFDNRQVDEVKVAAWFEVLRDADYDVCKAAVLDHFRGPNRHDYFQIGHVVDFLERETRSTAKSVEADVRSAKARGIVGRDWPERKPLDAGHARELLEARDRDREFASAFTLESAG